MELSHKPMEFTMCYENTVECCCIPVCKNAQYDKDWQKTNIGLFKFPDKDAKPELYKLWCNKSKHSEKLEGKIRLKSQVTHMYANFILILLI